jgi:hypothetical protein
MQCKSQVATRIENIFVTVERLVDAIESDTPLTEHQGVGPATADVITHWWENRFEREEQIDDSSVERTGAKTATIHFHKSWSTALETDTDESHTDHE